ncbi:hypothetical protein SASPL_145080 [Salvia splendens]|uniref:Homeobox-leucine zipper protein n=1 Tax=Salvia splendens TaxID=180675 RepID=A0A8X8WGF5_SALSN|nr:homeobox-leucine zipper protein ATHB-6-like [Salvia splendens]KAG6394493.1 hypothetical protein SASPL_145080 [Salvia splendens]
MKRLGSSEMSMCPNSTVDVDEHNHHGLYTTELEGMEEESGRISEKKRRLSVDQVKALEKNFEVDNKLEPERKVKLAQELGLQPRQVAVWFQNRRARWKTKQLERDYGLLKASHDALNRKYQSLLRENESFINQIREMKSELNGSQSEGKIALLEEKCDLEIDCGGGAAAELNFENCENEMIGAVFADVKDGSDSDSSAIVNDDNNSNSPIAAAISSSGGVPHRFGLTEASVVGDPNETQFVKIEEYNFFGEESCSDLFCEDQPPTLHWYGNEEWN